MSEDHLRPCPFCGESEQFNLAVEKMPGAELHPAYRVHCDNCGAATNYSRGDHMAEWNTRANDATARNDALEEARTKIREHSDIARRKISECYDTGDGDAAALWGAIISHLDIAHDTIRALKSETPS